MAGTVSGVVDMEDLRWTTFRASKMGATYTTPLIFKLCAVIATLGKGFSFRVSQVKEAPGHRDVGDIRCPHLVGPGELHAA